MEPLYFSIPALIAFLIFFTVSKLKKTNGKPLNLPPGPWKLPIIGNMHQMSGFLPHRKLGDLAKKHGSIMGLQLGEVTTVVVSSPQTAKEVMKTHDILFAQRPFLLATYVTTYGLEDIAFAPYGEYWRQVRKICVLELLSMKRVRSFQSIREEEASNLFRSIYSITGSVVDLSDLLLTTSCNLTVKATLGKKCKDQEAFLQATDEAIKLTGGFNIVDLFPSAKWLRVVGGFQYKLEKIQQKLDMFLQNIIDDRTAARKETKTVDHVDGAAIDLLDVLLNLQNQGDPEFPLTTTGIKAVIKDMLSGGSETSSTILEWTMSELLKNPMAMKKVQAELQEAFGETGKVDPTSLEELKYMNSVIKETLRLHPPLPLILPRECRQQCKINGYDIPAQAKVIVNVWAIGRDPNFWVDAEKFYPERFLDTPIDYRGNHFEYLPFGAGRRMCPGILFGMATVQHLLACLLLNFEWELPNGARHEDLDMSEDFGVTVRRKNPLNVIPILRRPSSSVK